MHARIKTEFRSKRVQAEANLFDIVGLNIWNRWSALHGRRALLRTGRSS